MKRPPMLMHVKIQGGQRRFGLWLPLFLLLPLALVVLIVLSPLLLIALLVLWPSGWAQKSLLVLWAAVDTFCSMRGLGIDVRSQNERVYISVV